MKESLKSQIHKSFANVQLGNGMGLFESQGIDDYETKEKCEAYRKKDEKRNWRALKAKHLNACYSSLTLPL